MHAHSNRVSSARILHLQVYNGGLVDERMAAALKHIGLAVTHDEGEASKYAMTTVIMRCCQLLLQMTPFADDLTALAVDAETEPEDHAYYKTLLQGVMSVSTTQLLRLIIHSDHMDATVTGCSRD